MHQNFVSLSVKSFGSTNIFLFGTPLTRYLINKVKSHVKIRVKQKKRTMSTSQNLAQKVEQKHPTKT